MSTRCVAAIAAVVACGAAPPATTTAAMPASHANPPGCSHGDWNGVATRSCAGQCRCRPRVDEVAGVIRRAISDDQHVAAGTVIVEIDDADYLTKVTAAQATLAAAMAQADVADVQVEIAKSTAAGGLSPTKAERQGTRASVRSATPEVELAEASVARAKA